MFDLRQQSLHFWGKRAMLKTGKTTSWLKGTYLRYVEHMDNSKTESGGRNQQASLKTVNISWKKKKKKDYFVFLHSPSRSLSRKQIWQIIQVQGKTIACTESHTKEKRHVPSPPTCYHFTTPVRNICSFPTLFDTEIQAKVFTQLTLLV